MRIKIITKDNYKITNPNICSAFFSSLLNGITTDPDLMNIPVDDHLVQRGDGVFEAIRVINGQTYHLCEHLLRLESSAKKISLQLTYSLTDIEEIIKQCIAVAKVKTAVIRLFFSRGRGSFSVNPYDTTGSQLYIAVTNLILPDAKMYTEGVKVYLSKILPKPSPFSNIKSCNYLPNVMMKKEAIDKQAHFSLSFDEEGFLAEGATENVLLLTQDNQLITPSHKKTLEGTTLNSLLRLAKTLNTDIKHIAYKNINKKELLNAKEVMLCSTILEVLPVAKITDSTEQTQSWTNFTLAKTLRALLQKDMLLSHSTTLNTKTRDSNVF